MDPSWTLKDAREFLKFLRKAMEHNGFVEVVDSSDVGNQHLDSTHLLQVQQHFHKPIKEAARDLGMCTTVLKKICRKNGVQRWPYRKLAGMRSRL